MLALVGSGEYLPPIEPLDRELIRRLPNPVKVICLPTAAGTEGDERIRYWMRLGVEHFTRLGVTVEALPVTDHETANNPEFAQKIEGANFVYLSGGKPDYLHRSLDNTLVWKAILAVLDRGGLVAGCSAGAMIMGEKMFRFGGWNVGFNFLPNAVIIPHFDEIPEAMVQPALLLLAGGITVVGVERNTALVKTDTPEGPQYEAVGTGGVTIWTKDHKKRYTQGAIAEMGTVGK
jgi:cyanophycinase